MDNKLTETGSSNRRVAAVPIWWVGNRRMIKRRIFDEYIEQMYSI